MLKNGLIVPVGAKGGFVLRRAGLSRARGARAGRRAVPRLRRGPARPDRRPRRRRRASCRPPASYRRDGDDPYLVVAADKGTAHLSDAANAIALARGFWLGDAFASGGSEGYDHKKFAITARGAWECAKHHFAELGIDPERDAFTVAGIGDMSGDVFGNGAAARRAARKLLAAFDHRHVFLDPDPDPERRAAPSASASSSCPPRAGPTTTAPRSRRAAASSPRGAKQIPLSAAARASASALDGRPRHRPRAGARDPGDAASTCSGTAASAPT